VRVDRRRFLGLSVAVGMLSAVGCDSGGGASQPSSGPSAEKGGRARLEGKIKKMEDLASEKNSKKKQ
jgi:hypothetical protein